jgi:aminoglycoside 3-N-acetyltransferase
MQHRNQSSANDSGYATADLAADLRRLGVRSGDVLIVHSSMKSLGRVQGGPETVVAALQQAVGPRGTIIMPAFAFHFEKVYSPIEPYDPKTTPSKVGLISETFRSMNDVQRSGHPTHSAAAWGALAEELIACDWSPDDTRSIRAMTAAAARGAKVLMIGCDFTSLSLLHAAEELADSPYIKIFCERHLGWKPSARFKDVRGRPQSIPLDNVPGCSRAFGAAQSLAKTRGLLREGRLGQAACLLFDAQAVLDTAVAQLRRKPDFLLCLAGTCRDCDDRRAALEPSSPDAAEIIRFTIDILADCGYRLAGSDGEQLAAERIARRMREIGLNDVTIHRFPISAWRPGFSRFEVRDGRRWKLLESAPVSHSPSTGGKTIRGRLAHLECLAGLDKLDDPRGAIAVLWDGFGDSFDEFRHLMDAGFAAIIAIDKRFTHEDVVAAGVPARWLDAFTTPMITLPHPTAVRWFSHGATECRIKIDGRVEPGQSTVVTGEIPGETADVILLCGHHDSTFNSTAPDDNLSGVAVTLQAAAMLVGKKLRPKRTVRFCSFGAEEQLSEGARWYAFESGKAKNVRLVLNNDSVGARLGTTHVYAAGGEGLAEWFRGEAGRSAMQFKVVEELNPFSDHFPLTCLGASSLWFFRQTMAGGRHFHHTVRDTLGEIAPDYLAELAAFEAAIVERLSQANTLPFGKRFSAEMKKTIKDAKEKWLRMDYP